MTVSDGGTSALGTTTASSSGACSFTTAALSAGAYAFTATAHVLRADCDAFNQLTLTARGCHDHHVTAGCHTRAN